MAPRKKKADAAALIRTAMAAQVTDQKDIAKLEKYGFNDPKEQTVKALLTIAQIERALLGDTRALADTWKQIGEDGVSKIEAAKIKESQARARESKARTDEIAGKSEQGMAVDSDPYEAFGKLIS